MHKYKYFQDMAGYYANMYFKSQYISSLSS